MNLSSSSAGKVRSRIFPCFEPHFGCMKLHLISVIQDGDRENERSNGAAPNYQLNEFHSLHFKLLQQADSIYNVNHNFLDYLGRCAETLIFRRVLVVNKIAVFLCLHQVMVRH